MFVRWLGAVCFCVFGFGFRVVLGGNALAWLAGGGRAAFALLCACVGVVVVSGDVWLADAVLAWCGAVFWCTFGVG